MRARLVLRVSITTRTRASRRFPVRPFAGQRWRQLARRVFVRGTLRRMCRNIKTLFNFDPPATDEEIRAASLQFVRKLSGFQKPSQANEAAFTRAVDEVAESARVLISSLTTAATPRDRELETQRARLRSQQRFARE